MFRRAIPATVGAASQLRGTGLVRDFSVSQQQLFSSSAFVSPPLHWGVKVEEQVPQQSLFSSAGMFQPTKLFRAPAAKKKSAAKKSATKKPATKKPATKKKAAKSRLVAAAAPAEAAPTAAPTPRSTLTPEQRKLAIENFQKEVKLSDTSKFYPRPAGFVPGMDPSTRTAEQTKYMEYCYGYGYANFKDRMNPEFILYATTQSDVINTVAYCDRNDIALAVRTGAHHYIGSSASGPDTVVLDVSLSQMEDQTARKNHVWNSINITHDGSADRIVAGCAANLGDFATKLDQAGLFLPFGQCMPVCVGGHSQSGGNGPAHTVVAGYLSDYIHSLTVVLTDPQAGAVIKTLYRDDTDRAAHGQTEAENDLFWALAGGSPGSFGVCLSATFSTLKNSDWIAPLNYSRKMYTAKKLMERGVPLLEAGVESLFQSYPCKAPYTKERFRRVMAHFAKCNDSMARFDETTKTWVETDPKTWLAPKGISYSLYLISPGGPRWSNLITGEFLPQDKLPKEPTAQQDTDDFQYRKEVFDRLQDKAKGAWNNPDISDIDKLIKELVDKVPLPKFIDDWLAKLFETKNPYIDTPLMFWSVYAFRPQNSGMTPEEIADWETRCQKFFDDLEEAIQPNPDELKLNLIMYLASLLGKHGPKADPANTMSQATLTTTFPVEKEYLRAFEKRNTLGGVLESGERSLSTNGFVDTVVDAMDELFTREFDAEGKGTRDLTKGVFDILMGGPGTNPGDGKSFPAHRGRMQGWCEWETWWAHNDAAWANDWSARLSKKMHDKDGDHMWCDRQRRLIALPFGSDDIMADKELQLAYWETDEKIDKLLRVKKQFDPNETFSASKFGIGGQKGSSQKQE